MFYIYILMLDYIYSGKFYSLRYIQKERDQRTVRDNLALVTPLPRLMGCWAFTSAASRLHSGHSTLVLMWLSRRRKTFPALILKLILNVFVLGKGTENKRPF